MLLHMPGMPERHNQWVWPHVGRDSCLSCVQRPGAWGIGGPSPSYRPARLPPGPLQGETETEKAIAAAHSPHQGSKISASLALRKGASEVLGL